MNNNKSPQEENPLFGAELLRKRPRVGAVVALIGVMIIIGLLSAMGLSGFLNDQLFTERQTHLLEITQKVADVIDVTISSTLGDALTCEELLQDEGSVSHEELLVDLADMTRYLNTEDGVILAFDQMSTYYTSDGETGLWGESSLLLETAPDQQVVVSALPYLDPDDAHLVFISRLREPIPIEGTDRNLTYVGVALEADAIKDVLAVPSFGDRSYTFIVNSKGVPLYRNNDLQEFMSGYNVLNSMRSYSVVNGCSLKELEDAVGNAEQACLEFDYNGENYFLGTAFIPTVSWEVILFVPTDVLGANTKAMMEKTSQYFLIIGIVILILVCAALFALTNSYSDKKLMRQEQKANSLLAKAAQEAEKANRAKSDFLSRMSHDIRTPINGIMGMTKIAEENIDDRLRVADCLTKIQGSSNHLLSLVNDVLDMSSIEQGKTVLSHEAVDITGVLNSCASIVSGHLLNRQVEFVTEFGEFTQPIIIGDELRLRQIFINILGNAVKFTPDGGKITFSGEEVTAGEHSALYRFVIEDTGRGMSEDFLEHIFEPFSQEMDKSQSTNYTGTGLGMAITKQFVDLMGGTIKVESRLGEGSKFTLEIAFDVDEDATLAKIDTENEVDLTGMKVLLVEDNPVNQEIAQYLLEEKGIEVTTAQNGSEAVEIFTANPPGSFQVILMDVMMPVMDGIEAAKMIRASMREDGRTIPIIAMTANAYEEDKKRTMAAGMNQHLSKPINGPLLFKTLAHYYAPKS